MGLSKRVKINGKSFDYSLKRRRGMRSMRLAIHPDGTFVVTAPKWYPVYAISRFIQEKADWIFEKLQYIDFQELADKKNSEKTRYKSQKEFARNVIKKRVEFFNCFYNFEFNRISIKNQKTCWGSCSRNGNLNFNYKVAELSEELRDYVVVHELCHLQELNHSRKFWELVSKVVPDYKILRKRLRVISQKS
jgi:predicted metal-dependent hydrolase